MVSIKCDRCGCLIDKKEEHYLLNYYKGDTPDKEYYLDLCPECKSKFVGFMEELDRFDWDSSIGEKDEIKEVCLKEEANGIHED